MDKKNMRDVERFIDRYPRFHVELDNDMFILSSEAPPDWESSTEKEFNKWEKKVKTMSVYENPIELLILLIEEAGGTVSMV